MAAKPPKPVNKTAKTEIPSSVRRLAAEADKALARAELAKRQVRAAKAGLKKARKLSKAAKKAAKQATKKALAAQALATTAGRAKATRPVKPAAGVKPAVRAKPAAGAKQPGRPKPAARMPSAADVARSVIKRLGVPSRNGGAPAENRPASIGADHREIGTPPTGVDTGDGQTAGDHQPNS